jgi:hypothetical protein
MEDASLVRSGSNAQIQPGIRAGSLPSGLAMFEVPELTRNEDRPGKVQAIRGI